ncbi:MAG: hypothetical protein QOF10_4873 [Kribbellaceae bacterium]|nr:hypothetical protein [Kribbellaceae bacterium]
MPGRTRRWTAVGTTMAVLGCLVACDSAAGAQLEGPDPLAPTATPPPEPQLLLTFDDQEPGSAEGREILGEGSAAVEVAVLSRNKPKTTFQPGHEGGIALRFPAYSGEAKGSFGALRVEPEVWLSPGESEFSFGADIRLDAQSSGSAIDNGDNVMQRGLFADAAQFKIQVDKHYASCVVRGADGAVVVKSKVALAAANWYRLTCHRLDKTVTLTVEQLDSTQQPAVVSKTGAIGPLELTGAEPLSIGAKTGADGEIIKSSTDQFNGWIDNITYLRT